MSVQESGHPSLRFGRYVSVECQIENIWRWNKKRRWSIPRGWDHKLETPPWPNERLVSVNVVAYLADKGGTPGHLRTFNEYLAIIAAQHPSNYYYAGLSSIPSFFQLFPGVRAHEPGVRIEIIDHGANWDKANGTLPMINSLDSSLLPTAGLLASAAHHPKRVRKMNGTATPYEWFTGYLVKVLHMDGPRLETPFLAWNSYEQKVVLGLKWGGCSQPTFSVPMLRE